MHIKKPKSHKLHSIPISLCRNNCKRLYLVSYSIPLACVAALLLIGLVIINPSNTVKTSAITIQDEWVITDNKSENSEKLNTLLSDSENSNEDEVDDSFGGFGGDDIELSQSDQDAGISLMSTVSTPTLSITVSNTSQTIQAVQGGDTVYGSYDVSIAGNNVKDYTLSIKADSVNLASPSQASTPTTITGAGGKTGSNMSANTWGYKLTETSTAESSYGTLAYANLPTSLTSIASGNVASPYNLSASKKLVFAAKFAETAAPGTYSGHITLSAVASQAVVGAIWSNGVETNITDMQDISSGFCKNNSKIATGDTITLKDSRQNGIKSYKIVKLKDGNCWMQENLKLGGDSAITLTSANTNIMSNYTLPANSVGAWSNTGALSQIKVGNVDLPVNKYNPGTGWQPEYGNYYSWCAATAGTCSETTSNNVNVSGSICPKGWHLPSGGSTSVTSGGVGTDGEFYKLFNGLSWSIVTNLPYSFPRAGSMIDSDTPFASPGYAGRYWSRTSSNGGAYSLIFAVDAYHPGTFSNSRYYGYSVRCVADY